MSVVITKSGHVTMFTVTSDPESTWPPLCQILKNLCYSPVCCSVSRRLKNVQNTFLSGLGVMQIMIGLLNIGFGMILFISPSRVWTLKDTGFPFWLGAMFIVFGVMCILSERYPSPCLVGLNLTLNLSGLAFAVTAIVLYSINLAEIGFWFACSDDWYYERRTTPSPSLDNQLLLERCAEGRELLIVLLRGISAVMIVLSVLELCVIFSLVVLGIKAMKNKGNQTSGDPEHLKPLMMNNAEKPAA